MFSFHVDSDFYIFEKLIAQIGPQPVLGTQFCFDGPGDLWVNINKMKRLKLVQ